MLVDVLGGRQSLAILMTRDESNEPNSLVQFRDWLEGRAVDGKRVAWKPLLQYPDNIEGDGGAVSYLHLSNVLAALTILTSMPLKDVSAGSCLRSVSN